MDELLKKPYMPWLESALKAMVEVDPTSIYLGLVKGREVTPLCWNLSKESRGYILQNVIDIGVIEYIMNNKEDVAEMVRRAFEETNPDEYQKQANDFEKELRDMYGLDSGDEEEDCE